MRKIHYSQDIVNQVIAKYLNFCTQKQISADLNISLRGVVNILKCNHVKIRKRGGSTYHKDYSGIADEIINRYTNREPYHKIAKDLHIAPESVKKILIQNNITIRDRGELTHRKFSLNENFFHDINSDEQAYWLGFFAADGHLRHSGISIHLQQKDKEHLFKMVNALESNAIVEDINITNSCRVGFWSKKLSSDLIKLGFQYNKTETCQMPSILSTWYPAFIRGYMDGDGCLQCYQRTKRSKNNVIYNTVECVLSLCGTVNMMTQISQIISDNLPVLPRTLHISKTNNNIAVIKYNGRNQCLLILDWLHHNSELHLDRKYDIYQNMLEINPGEFRSHKYLKKS